jgi:hypothetical protein
MSSDNEQRRSDIEYVRKDPMDKGRGRWGSCHVSLRYFGIVIMGSAISTLAGIGMAIGCVCITIIRYTIAEAA